MTGAGCRHGRDCRMGLAGIIECLMAASVSTSSHKGFWDHQKVEPRTIQIRDDVCRKTKPGEKLGGAYLYTGEPWRAYRSRGTRGKAVDAQVCQQWPPCARVGERKSRQICRSKGSPKKIEQVEWLVVVPTLECWVGRSLFVEPHSSRSAASLRVGANFPTIANSVDP